MTVLRRVWSLMHSRFLGLLRRQLIVVVVVKVMSPPRLRSLAIPSRRIAPAVAAAFGQLSLF